MVLTLLSCGDKICSIAQHSQSRTSLVRVSYESRTVVVSGYLMFLWEFYVPPGSLVPVQAAEVLCDLRQIASLSVASVTLRTSGIILEMVQMTL